MSKTLLRFEPELLCIECSLPFQNNIDKRVTTQFFDIEKFEYLDRQSGYIQFEVIARTRFRPRERALCDVLGLHHAVVTMNLYLLKLVDVVLIPRRTTKMEAGLRSKHCILLGNLKIGSH